MSLLILIAASQIAPSLTPEAESLGRRLAAMSGIATIAPQLIEKDILELSKEDKTLSASERTRLLTMGHIEGRRNLDRLIATLGHAYASRLSVPDLRRLVADNEAPAAARRRTIEPAAIMETMAGLGQLDLKKNVASAFCREMGKLCHR